MTLRVTGKHLPWILLLFALPLSGSDAQWSQTAGPQGGAVNCLLNTGTSLLAGTQSGVRRSSNGGVNWGRSDLGLGDRVVNAFGATPTSLFLGTNGGLFQSSDDGTSWRSIGSGTIQVTALASDGGRLLIGESIGLQYSDNDGSNWSTSSLPSAYQVLSIAARGGIALAGWLDQGIYSGMSRSTDGGATWNPVISGAQFRYYGSILFKDSLMFASNGSSVIASLDTGKTWITRGAGLPSGNPVHRLFAAGQFTFAGSDNGVYRSSDNGISWERVGMATSGLSILDFTLDGATLVAATGTAGILLSNDNGDSWNEPNTGIRNAAVQVLAGNLGDLWAGSGSNGVFLSSNQGMTWSHRVSPPGGLSVNTFAFANPFVLAGNPAGIHRSNDNGGSWIQVSDLQNVWQIITSGPNLFAGSSRKGIWMSTDQGASWNEANNGILDSLVKTLTANGTYMCAGTFNGNVYWSTDNGALWTQGSMGLPGRVISVLASNATTVFAGCEGGGIYRSSNQGSGWESVTAALPSRAQLSSPYGLITHGQYLYASVYSAGVFQSTDNGTSWRDITAGLADTSVYALAIVDHDLYVGTSGSSVWGTSLIGLEAPEAPRAIPATAIQPAAFIAHWDSVPGAAEYRFDVSTDSLFSSFVPGYGNVSAGAQTAAPVTGLTTATLYYYRVRAVNATGTSPNSNVIGVPTLTLPPTGLGVTNLSDTGFVANWASSIGAEGYRLDVATDNLFTQFLPSYNDRTVPGTSEAVTGLSGGATCFFRVRAINAGGPSANSDTLHVVLLPSAPTAQAATGIATTEFTAHWDSTRGATGYRLDVATDPGFSQFVAGYNNILVNGLSRLVSGLSPSQTYYYRVRAEGVSGTSTNSNTVTVTTPTPAGVPSSTAATGVATNSFIANWSEPMPVPDSYQLDVATDAGFAQKVGNYDSLPVEGLSQFVSGLTSGTIYFYRVRGVNGGTPTANSNTTAVITLPAPPVIRPASQISTTGFTANWDSSGGAVGYRLDVATDAAFTAFVPGFEQRDVTKVTAYPVTGLSENTMYHYRVSAYNQSGLGPPSNRSTVTTSTTSPPPAPAATAATYLSSTSFVANWDAAATATGYLLDVSTDDQFGTFLAGYDSKDVGGAFTIQVTGLTAKTAYYYRVWAYNANGTSGSSSQTVSVTTPVIALSQTIPFASRDVLTASNSTDYRLVGIPGNSGRDISTFLQGHWRTEWEVYWDNGKHGSPSDYYTEYQAGNSIFVCSTGKAYWILSRSTVVLNDSVNTASYDTSHQVIIPLMNGPAAWQLIADPYLVDISWSGVSSINGFTDSIATWNGTTMAFASTMEPYKGYLFYNGSNATSVRIPYSLTLPRPVSRAPADGAGWRVGVVLHSGGFADRTTYFGVVGSGADGATVYQQHKPRFSGFLPVAYFELPAGGGQTDEFSTDYRERAGESDTWEMKIRSSGKQPVSIEFTGLEGIPADRGVALIDEAGGRGVDLRSTSTYIFRPSSPESMVNVIVGRPDLVAKAIEAVRPTSFALLQNYPNPFNPSTSIPVALPRASRVILRIYNALGQRVTTLCDGELPAGRSVFLWEGGDDRGMRVSSGVYFCRMEVPGSFRQVVKLNLLQ
jgi:phosphodiesterase/alkaline phosphatase D-like protein